MRNTKLLVALACLLEWSSSLVPVDSSIALTSPFTIDNDATLEQIEHEELLLSQLTAGVSSYPRPNGSSSGGLVWHDLHIETSDHVILVPATSGMLHNGALTGLLGPSGSGKTTLMSALAGLCPLSVHGLVRTFVVSEEPSTSTEEPLTVSRDSDDILNTNSTIFKIDRLVPRQVAWLQQQDDFFSQLTVQETLELAAFMELPNVNAHERRALVQQTSAQLGLQHALHRPVGDVASLSSTSSSSRGPLSRKKSAKHDSAIGTRSSSGRLSGGERRRLSVGLELLTSKQLIVADEPTTGLDSTYSATVMKLLKDLAVSRNIPALCSLHQPRSSIWSSLDAVILMAPRGRVVYAGLRADAISYFEQLGYPLPDRTNPAEHLIDLVSIDSEDAIQAVEDEARINHLVQSFVSFQRQEWANAAVAATATTATASTARSKHPKQQRPRPKLVVASESNGGWSSALRSSHASGKRLFGWIPRLAALWRRSWRQNIRDVGLNRFRLLACAGNAILLAGIFPTVAPGRPPMVNSIADRVALLSFGAINLCMLAYMKAVTLFAQERPVVRREQIREQYSVLEYLVAKVLAELPLDVAFSAVFTTCLKRFSGLQISWRRLTSIFSLLTTAGVSLGYLIGSFAPSEQYASSSGIPVLVILMVVGIINPSGVDVNSPPPLIVSLLRQVSPFTFAIESLCLGEYPGVKFSSGSGGFFSRIKSAPRMGGLAMVKTGDQVIEALGLQNQTYENAMRHLGLLSVMNMAVSWLGLLRQQYLRRRLQGSSRTNTRRTAPLPVRQRSANRIGLSSDNDTTSVRVPIISRI